LGKTDSGWKKAGRDLLSGILAVVRREPTFLIPFDWVKEQIGLKGRWYRGLQVVGIDRIVGSLNRYRDFDRAFLPRRATAERTERIDRLQAALERGEEFPPVVLYKVGEVYFVVDGHHRVAAARQEGAQEIDAEVVEFEPTVPIEAGVTKKDFLIKAEYAEFLRRTHLDRIRPAQRIVFTEPGRYHAVLEHIAVHRYFLGLEQGREIPYEEAVASWFDHVYTPLAEAFRRLDLLKQFPGRTEADLYGWVSEHLYYLREQYGPDVNLEQAVLDYARNYGLNWLSRLFHAG
jgi:hypothetical protein